MAEYLLPKIYGRRSIAEDLSPKAFTSDCGVVVCTECRVSLYEAVGLRETLLFALRPDRVGLMLRLG